MYVEHTTSVPYKDLTTSSWSTWSCRSMQLNTVNFISVLIDFLFRRVENSFDRNIKHSKWKSMEKMDATKIFDHLLLQNTQLLKNLWIWLKKKDLFDGDFHDIFVLDCQSEWLLKSWWNNQWYDVDWVFENMEEESFVVIEEQRCHAAYIRKTWAYSRSYWSRWTGNSYSLQKENSNASKSFVLFWNHSLMMDLF